MHGCLHVAVAVVVVGRNDNSTSSATTTLTAGLPLIKIVLCSSLSATVQDRGGVDSVADSSLSRKNK
jgi:hypothetical protein